MTQILVYPYRLSESYESFDGLIASIDSSIHPATGKPYTGQKYKLINCANELKILLLNSGHLEFVISEVENKTLIEEIALLLEGRRFENFNSILFVIKSRIEKMQIPFTFQEGVKSNGEGNLFIFASGFVGEKFSASRINFTRIDESSAKVEIDYEGYIKEIPTIGNINSPYIPKPEHLDSYYTGSLDEGILSPISENTKAKLKTLNSLHDFYTRSDSNLRNIQKYKNWYFQEIVLTIAEESEKFGGKPFAMREAHFFDISNHGIYKIFP